MKINNTLINFFLVISIVLQLIQSVYGMDGTAKEDVIAKLKAEKERFEKKKLKHELKSKSHGDKFHISGKNGIAKAYHNFMDDLHDGQVKKYTKEIRKLDAKLKQNGVTTSPETSDRLR